MPENVLAFEVIPPARYIRFGPFELDTRTGELRKHGIKIRLRHQPLQILLMLLKHPGEVVLRDEIRQTLWPRDTVVEFEHSINAAVQKLRDALGDSAEDPKYVETLPRRGYRFIGSVEKVPAEPVGGPVSATIPAAIDAPAEQASPTASSRRWLLPVAGIAVVGLIVWLNPWSARPARNWTLSLGEVSRAVVSPDGSAALYPTAGGLVLRRLDSLDETPLYNSEPITDIPAWSPDGSQILFDTTNGLVRMRVPDGQPVTIWRGDHITRGYSWGPGGTILMATLGNPSGGELYLLPAEGGTPLLLGMPGLTNGRFFYPEFLPDGENILFAWAGFEDADAGLYLATIRNRKVTRGPLLLRRNQTAGHYSSSGGGRLLFVADDKLFAQRLDISRGTLQGEPERIVDGVHSMVGRCRASFSVSRGGVLVWRAGRAALAQLTWFDRTGKVLGVAGPLHVAEVVRLSPDEKHVLIPTSSETAGYSVVESNRTGHVVLPGVKKPIWMPDSSHILYARNDGATFRVLERAAGGGAEREVARLPAFLTLCDVSADGKVLLYRAGFALYTLRLDGSQSAAKPEMVAQAVQGKLSPDGRWVVYGRNFDGSTQAVYVQPLSSGGLRSQIPSARGKSLVWRGDGKEILFIEGATVYSVLVDVKGDTFNAGQPEALFKVRLPDGLSGESNPLAVTRDGSRILFAQGVEQPNPQLTYVMTAWDTLLKR